MREMTIDELKEVQLQILDFVAEFCEKNQIQYWIDSGTLLGAIRHKGYIPWDDDIDVGMLRKDYDKFFKLFNDPGNRYQFVCYEKQPDFYLPHGKVCDVSTVLYEPNEKGHRLSVNIDIFVYDNAPEDNSEVMKMYNRRDKLRNIYNIKNDPLITTKNFVKNIAKYIRKYMYKLWYWNSDPIRDMIENSKRYSLEETSKVGNFMSYTRMSCDKKVFKDFVDVEFEGKFYKAPIGYDEWLRAFYGNYMELPPEEKRVSHHMFKAYVLEEVVEEFVKMK